MSAKRFNVTIPIYYVNDALRLEMSRSEKMIPEKETLLSYDAYRNK